MPGAAARRLAGQARRDPGLVAKLGLTILYAAIFAGGLTALLAYFNLQTAYLELNRAGYQVLADQLTRSIEYNLNLGLGLGEARNAQTLLEATAERHPEVGLLRVFDPTGTILYDLEPAAAGTQVEAYWLHGRPLDTEGVRVVETPELYILTLPIHNNFNVQVGTLALGYGKDAADQVMREALLFLSRSAGLVVALVGGLIMGLVWLGTWRFRHRLAAMETALGGLLRDSAHDPSEVDDAGKIEAHYLAFHEKSQELLISFDNAERELRALESGK